jgi:hypothetical protein
MKKFILLFLLIPSLCFAVEPIDFSKSIAMSPAILGGSGGGPAAAGCNPATNEVGNRATELTSQSCAADIAMCFLSAADCSGDLDTAYVYGSAASGNASVKVCVYSSDGGNPGSGDLKIGCSGGIAESGGVGWKSGVMDGGSVIASSSYWVCLFVSTTEAWSAVRNSTGTLWYKATSGAYDTPPANLSSVTNSIAWAPLSLYVTIK